MRTNLTSDPALSAGTPEPGGEMSGKAAVDPTPRAFIAHEERTKLREMSGRLLWNAVFDHKRERTRT